MLRISDRHRTGTCQSGSLTRTRCASAALALVASHVLGGDAWQPRGEGAERFGVYDRIEHGLADVLDVLLEADQNLAVQAAAIAWRPRFQPRVQAVGDVLECQRWH